MSLANGAEAIEGGAEATGAAALSSGAFSVPASNGGGAEAAGVGEAVATAGMPLAAPPLSTMLDGGRAAEVAAAAVGAGAGEATTVTGDSASPPLSAVDVAGTRGMASVCTRPTLALRIHGVTYDIRFWARRILGAE
jgi:hypothetical protein